MSIIILDTMSPNAVFQYAGDRETVDEDDTKDIEVSEKTLARYSILLVSERSPTLIED